MIAPPGVLIIEDFLSAAMREQWCAFMDAQSTKSLWAKHSYTHIESGEVKYEFHEGRITENINFAEYKTDVLREVVRGYRDCVTRFFSR